MEMRVDEARRNGLARHVDGFGPLGNVHRVARPDRHDTQGVPLPGGGAPDARPGDDVAELIAVQIGIGDDAAVENVHTVNGSLSLGSGVAAGSLETVNGSISLGENSTASGSIEAVNGRIRLEKGSKVSDSISNVNGDITLEGSEVDGDLSTVNGDVELTEGAVLHGDLVIEKPGMWSWGSKSSRVPQIVIGPGSTVGGVIRVEREVKLYISESAEVGGVEGEMSMEDAIRFGGKRP